MTIRPIKKMVCGRKTVDGAGVHLLRVLRNDTVEDFDPFLMLDSFDSRDPDDYIKGFPMHPHRGIETVTYLIEGEIEHQDSLGNKGVIRGGESQWMTAGSGILHQEMPQPCERMLGVQLWLNLPREQKMIDPSYFGITADKIGVARLAEATVRVIAGAFGDVRGASPPHQKADIFDVSLLAGKTLTLPTNPDYNVFAFILEGDALAAGQSVPEKVAVLFGPGGAVELSAPAQQPVRFLLCGAKPLREPVAWGGPIVMNTQQELRRAFEELENGRFIKHNAEFL